MVPDWVAARIDAERWEPIGGGYTRAFKWRATLRDGTTVFVKAADDELGLRMVRVELLIYQGVAGMFLPHVVDVYHEDERALLVLEDLSSAHWPPPYPSDVRSLFAALERVAATTPPSGLRRLEESGETPWKKIDALGVCSSGWLARAVGPLEAAENSFSVAGDELIHCDVWTDNVCFAERGPVLVDWAAARIGNRWVDVGFALLSLIVEGGERPPLEISNEPGLAAYVAGAVAREATATLPDWARPGSTLREEQRG